KYTGVPQVFHQMSGKQNKDLVCVCFGIYKEEITNLKNNLQKEGFDISIDDISFHLLAGAGCMKCREEIANLLSS
ncbi:MAG: (2Fe-2S)-binding protein, partial [Bacteriovoracia bacterium]